MDVFDAVTAMVGWDCLWVWFDAVTAMVGWDSLWMCLMQ